MFLWDPADGILSQWDFRLMGNHKYEAHILATLHHISKLTSFKTNIYETPLRASNKTVICVTRFADTA